MIEINFRMNRLFNKGEYWAMDEAAITLAQEAITNHQHFDVVTLTNEGALEDFLLHYSYRPTKPLGFNEEGNPIEPGLPDHVPQIVGAKLNELITRFESETAAIRQDAAIALVRQRVDELAERFVERYTATEAKAWTAWQMEAKAFDASADPADAPLLAFEAAIRGDTLENRVAEVLAAAQVTALIPSIASGARGRAEAMIAASNGDAVIIQSILDLLLAKGQAILAAASQGDHQQMVTLATEGWEV
jgi:hypothetical protein